MFGLCFNYAWLMHGLSLDYARIMRTMLGLCLEYAHYAWIMLGFGLDTWIMSIMQGLWLNYIWSDNSWIMFGLCLDYGLMIMHVLWFMLGLCMVYAWVMSIMLGLCLDYAEKSMEK